MQEKLKRKALFLDRDGTINIDKDYLFRIEDFEFQPGIFDLIRSYSDQDYLIFIITNQSGIARGYYTENDYLQLTQWMTEQLQINGIHVEKVYHCPHHPEITGSCTCRKPKPGLIVQALKEYPIDPERSVLIGDKERDILAGQNAGIGKNLYIQPLLKKGVF
ncbi:HAD family hydrolase [Maribellus luteus]|uniref:D,D-heptose 1,7-bisphosphate phosphatase n=1 Tax=Maribellus luteus TaxID=2305463 RepID=A0A399SPZ7_9BACT|nr:HAD family hydrolase [Maribellus luteus]RIJ46086.1 HAD family hydrolase [Maribellus luteus]